MLLRKFKDLFLLPRLIHNKTIYVMLLKHVLDIYPKYSFKRKQIFFEKYYTTITFFLMP